MVLERKLLKMVQVMWEYSKMEREMVKVHTITLMETSMKGNGRMGKNMVKVHSLLLMEENGQVSSEGINLGTLLDTTKTETSKESG